MNWFWENRQWFFSGAGVSIAVGLIYLARRFFLRWLNSRKQPVGEQPKAILKAEEASVSGSPVASGSGITQTVNAPTVHVNNVNIGLEQSKPAVPPRPARLHPNIQLTGESVVRVALGIGDVWSEAMYGQVAIVIQFTNEAKPGSQNTGALVRASLVYRDDRNELLRITGCWVNGATDLAEFRVDETHKLIAGVYSGNQLVAFEKRRIRVDFNSDQCPMHQHQLPRFQNGTLRVRLTDAQAGDILYEGQFLLNVNPLNIVPQ